MGSFRVASLRKPAVGAALLSSEAIGGRLDDLERKMERLRSLYESFFLGVDRRPPQMPRQELNRLMLEMQQLSIRNAALRFRFQALAQRWTLLTTYWNRTLREIESGTYRRDLQKAYRRIAARGNPLTEDEATALGIPLSRAKAFVAQQNRRLGTNDPAVVPSQADVVGRDASSQQPSQATTAAGPAAAGNSTTSAGKAEAGQSADTRQLEALQRDYAAAYARLALPGTPPTLQQLRAKLLPQIQRLQAARPGVPLELTVSVQDGRVVIRAKPAP